jgi:hypothetical protein
VSGLRWTLYNPSVEIRFCIETDRFLETMAKENNGVREAFDEFVWPRQTNNSAKFGEVRRSSISIELSVLYIIETKQFGS